MSDKMNKLKEVAGENELDKEMLDLIAGGNRAQTEELWNFYMSHGARGFLKKYEKNHAKGVLEALKAEGGLLFGNISSISNANLKNGNNVYHSIIPYNHEAMMTCLKVRYEAGQGHFGQVR